MSMSMSIPILGTPRRRRGGTSPMAPRPLAPPPPGDPYDGDDGVDVRAAGTGGAPPHARPGAVRRAAPAGPVPDGPLAAPRATVTPFQQSLNTERTLTARRAAKFAAARAAGADYCAAARGAYVDQQARGRPGERVRTGP